MIDINLYTLESFAAQIERALARGERMPKMNCPREQQKFEMLGAVATEEEFPLLRRELDKTIFES